MVSEVPLGRCLISDRAPLNSWILAMTTAISKIGTNRKTIAWAMIAVVAAIPAGFTMILQSQRIQGPALVIYGPTIYDLGSGKVGDVLTGDVILHNRGSSPLVYQLRTGCSCLKLTPNNGEIAPQDSLEISLGLRLRTEGRDESATVYIHTNDPAQSEVQLHLTAKCPAAFAVSPEAVDFGTIMKGSTARATISLLRAGRDPVAADTDVNYSVRMPFLAVKKETAGGKEVVLAITLQGNAPLGAFTDSLAVVIDGRTIRIPISGKIDGICSIVPPVLYVSRNRDASRVKEYSFFGFIRLMRVLFHEGRGSSV
jgi:hypothetical protein